MTDKERFLAVCNELKRISRLYSVEFSGWDDGSIFISPLNGTTTYGFYRYDEDKKEHERGFYTGDKSHPCECDKV